MLKKTLSFILLISISAFISNCAYFLKTGPFYEQKKEQKLIRQALNRVNRCISENRSTDFRGPIPPDTKVDSIKINLSALRLDIYLSKHFTYQPFRPHNIEPIYKLFRKYLGKKFNQYAVKLRYQDFPIEALVPNYFRQDSADYDMSRMPTEKNRAIAPIIKCEDKKMWRPTNGIYHRNLVLWHSHGFYYSIEKDRWEWQRPRLFNTVEDLLPMAFTVPYLIPMLENAGAVVFLPRERDLQIAEIIIDNDTAPDSNSASKYHEIKSDNWQNGSEKGFCVGTPPYPANFNPFLQGSYRVCPSDTMYTAGVEWIPNIPKTAMYGVYISYHASKENVPDAHYVVYHSGGKTGFKINQQIGGSTWIYLGQFKFKQGFDPENAKVVLQNKSEFPAKLVSADAVRFGGGMGNIIRGGQTSGYPRFAEAARYYLQYAGMPDTLVYHLNNDTTDYKDDYQSRGEFVNYLKGRPFGPNKNRDVDGLGIPIDLSLAFHTDAGIDTCDSTIGTLMIYSIQGADRQNVFPDSMSRLANRDLADILQTQIVEDLQLKYREDWSRRALRDADYSEVWRPNVPSALLELLSHQNFEDMKYALSPQFRFDVSRAIYKGILKFIATQYRYDYVVQPLPVSHCYSFFSNPAEVTLRWQTVTDPLEPTASPDRFIVYKQIDENGFDNGTLVDKNEFILNDLKKGVIYSFKITAVNNGGESFPSEILSVCWHDSFPPILIVNGFDRIAPPEYINEPHFKGFVNFIDPGVADQFDFNFTGAQFDFNPRSRYRTNDAPGHGASRANSETTLILGNTFDYPVVHGSAIKNCGYSFVSASDEALVDGFIELEKYKIIDLILGEEKITTFPNTNPEYSSNTKINFDYQAFPARLQQQLTSFCRQGGNLFVSGAYVGTDLLGQNQVTKSDSSFAREILKFNWQTDHAASTGKVICVDSLFLPRFSFFYFNNTMIRDDIYTAESPDAIDPVTGAKTLLRYAENRFGAATAFHGDYSVIVFGFPFETIIDETWRNRVMKAVLSSFLHN